ncbi:sugar phosphate isomerase/epimerase [Phragmitibacter flavus]|uniref:Sugar phosphate isomerase/epimerase n=1 Tax=Phragmitibacter flavus TaxID=2576071 RepID=A0A5R8KAP0_9BACT|nr:sugar phosphate isomerase/epimerase [Phragmitibacter flavus]TLD69371.1 sugar phosphate isomerase/epimerase [Phragmitibacter flavus]
MNRRRFLQTSTASLAFAGVARAQTPAFKLNYILGSAMYGELPLETVITETPKTGASLLDVWPRKHGSQREQMDELGHDKVKALLDQHNVNIGCFTRYDLGPFNLTEEFAIAQKFGAKLIVTGAKGPKGLQGPELKTAVKIFSEELKPHFAKAAEHDIAIVIENHGNNLVESPDSIRWLLEFTQDQPLGIELAPYHLPQDPALLAGLIKDLGNRMKMFLAWQYGKGCMKPMPKDEELQQMPGRGPLDFKPLLQALKDIQYTGYTQIFMHPTPRGIPILPTAEATTQEINQSRTYLDNLVSQL